MLTVACLLFSCSTVAVALSLDIPLITQLICLVFCAAAAAAVTAVVFGRVTEGMSVVKRVEALGSQSGKTRARITIADCGQVRLLAAAAAAAA
jgi:cyclophilin family peptidyl-prolyl cis-trans isomerase